ncbi:FecR domain-containing protein [Pseudomonas sp. RP23018S]|uniref:FecR domain-containing protein n=1 Tax=Pseudomonas sp. RP23018S TaxID=3096037 RepID=UPI002ACAE7ED|nr:FecR domain-containing protein [Pseudomonas sp. RP23018S]MDZ5604573.1 FecR domain-containing protein [Pseudomonas sp. RP23018S]
MEPVSRIRHATLQQAAQWYLTLQERDCPEAVHEQWRHWLAQHSEHQAAWHYVAGVGERFAPLREQAAHTGQVLRQERARGLTRRQTAKALALLGVGSLLGAAGWRVSTQAGWTADLATGVGDRRQIRLDDGSQLWLGPRTAVDTRFDPQARWLGLRFGEVLLQASARDVRPLRISTDCGEMEIGSGVARLSVRQQEGHTRLNVYQGQVSVSTARDRLRRDVAAGQGIAFTASRFDPLTAAQASGESWTWGVLAADAMPLSELVDTLGRYRHGHLGYAPAIADLRVMGTFPLDDTEQALRLLEAALPVRVRRLTDWWVSIEPA